MIQKPDYDNSILSVACSALKHFGVEDVGHATQADFDRALERNPKTVIVMLFDGLGTSLLEKHLPAGSFLRKHLVRPISSVFPPTTVAATTSIQSGLTPIEHGWLGWELYFPDVDDNITVFTNTAQKTHEPVPGKNLAYMHMPYRTVCDRISEAHPEIRTETVSPFAGFPDIRSAGSLCRSVRKEAEKGTRYMYAYWTNPDHDAHIFGVNSLKVRLDILRINAAVKRLSRQLDDAVIAVVADHGLTDVEWLYLEDYPVLEEYTSRQPSIESRCRSFFLKDDASGFRDKFQSALGDKFLLYSRQELLDAKLFGDGKPHPMTKEFIGEYVAVAKDRYCLSHSRHGSLTLKAHHAGMTHEEMSVPLILIDTKDR